MGPAAEFGNYLSRSFIVDISPPTSRTSCSSEATRWVVASGWQMVEVEGVALDVLARSEVVESLDRPIDRREAPIRVKTLQPSVEVAIPSPLFEAGGVLVADEPECQCDFIGIPRRRRTHPDLAQGPQYAYLFVAFSQIQFNTWWPELRMWIDERFLRNGP